MSLAGIDLDRDLRLVGRGGDVHVRRVVLAVLALLPVLALLNVFGQRPGTETANGRAADLEVYAPTRLRGGLLNMARFTITAHTALRHPTLVLDPGWFEGMQVNTVTPAPTKESSVNGKLVYEFEDIPAGGGAVVFAEFQVNPTNVGRRSQSVALEADGVPAIRVARTVTIFP
jgi:hypothetical protein